MPLKSRRLTSLQGKHVLITAGPTREYWDPVRFISNGSSGTMGIALARQARRRGARVTLVLGPIDPSLMASVRKARGIHVIPVQSARDMDRAVQGQLAKSDVFVGAAAVADYRPVHRFVRKIKKRSATLRLTLRRNPDIIAKAARPSSRRPGVVIGFALETHDVLRNARAKLLKKNLDWIVANGETNIGASAGTATLLRRDGKAVSLGRMAKERLAHRLWGAIVKNHD